jgi:hypothetical protein
MMQLRSRVLMLLVFATATIAPTLEGQSTGSAAADPSARLRQVLPPDVAAHVLTVIAGARTDGLPAGALEQRALKFAARGVPPADIERAIAEQAERQARVKVLLEAARGAASDDEVDAGAEAIREGLDGHDVSALAKSAPSGRSLTIPLYVLGSLTSRGLPSDKALARVSQSLAAGAGDADLEALPAQALNSRGGAPGEIGRDLGAARRPASAPGASGPPGGGPPAGVPANGGEHRHPTGPPNSPGKP